VGQRNLRRTSRFRQVREFWWAVLFLGGVLLDHGCYCTSTPWNELCRSGFRHGCACSQPPEKNRDKQRNQTQLWRVKKLKNLKSTHTVLSSPPTASVSLDTLCTTFNFYRRMNVQNIQNLKAVGQLSPRLPLSVPPSTSHPVAEFAPSQR